MTDEVTTTGEALTADEVRFVALHMSAANYHLHHSMEAFRHLFARLYPREMLLGQEGPIGKSLRQSQDELSEALKILVKDPSDD
jgi:hypothetical protein